MQHLRQQLSLHSVPKMQERLLLRFFLIPVTDICPHRCSAIIDMDNKQAIELINQIIKSLKYGNINIVIQDGKVVQIDKTEKMRIKN